MPKQEVMIKYGSQSIFFFKHTFKSAMQHAEEFIERNKSNFAMELYILNTSTFGETWLLLERVYKLIDQDKNSDMFGLLVSAPTSVKYTI